MTSRRRTAIAAAFLGLGLGLAGLAGAQAPSAPSATAPRVVPVEPVRDLGTVSRSERLEHVFTLRNEGAGELRISEVRPDCGCTVASFDKSIAPGATGTVKVGVETADFNGPIAKAVTVYSNDPQNPHLRLTVKAVVQPHIVVVPGYARFSVVQHEAPAAAPQTLWASDGSNLAITGVESPYPYVSVTYREATEGERLPEGRGRQWRIETTIDPATATSGALGDFVVVHTDHPRESVVRIPVSGFVRPVVAVTPAVADFGKLNLREPKHASFTVANYAAEAIAVTQVEAPLGVETELQPVEAGRRYRLVLTLTPDMPKGDFRSTLRIHTTSPKKPVVELELRGTVL